MTDSQRWLTDLEIATLSIIAGAIHQNAISKGFWDCPGCGVNAAKLRTVACPQCDGRGSWRNFGESIALIHSELSEALEAKRDPDTDDACVKCEAMGKLPRWHGDPSGADCPKCKGTGDAIGGSRVAEELADAIIRLLDLTESLGIDIGSVMAQKMEYNATRPHKHGKDF